MFLDMFAAVAAILGTGAAFNYIGHLVNTK